MHFHPQGRISTFYSYKGGTGRTMALANVAWILASKGKRVLAIDWDLEAPGLHRYFAPLLGDSKLAASPGLIDFLLEYWIAATHPNEEDDDPRWFERYADLAALALPVLADFPGGGRLDVIGAGRQDGGYAERVTSFDWKAFYASFGGAGFLDLTFDRLRLEYDYVLIDSRTGVSDTAGICTVQLPDSLVVFFTLNNQSIEGASGIAHDALIQRQSSGRAKLAVFPVPSRIDLFERDKLEIRRSLVRERFTDLLDLDDAARKRYFAEIELLYVPFYSYEEQLATIVDRPNQHASLLGSLERLTGHVSGGEVQQLMPMSDALRGDFRAKYDAFHRGETPSPGGEPDARWDIFLSYSVDDRATAASLYRQLQTRFKTFYDVEAINVGQNIAESVTRAAANSRITVILISRAALASTTLASEVEQLLDSDVPTRKTKNTLRGAKRVLPVLIGVEPDELPDNLSRLRAYRAVTVPADDQAPFAAARAIFTALGETPELEATLENRPPSAAHAAATTLTGGEIPTGSSKAASYDDGSRDHVVTSRRPRVWMLVSGLALFMMIAIVIVPSWSDDYSNVFVSQLHRAVIRMRLANQQKMLELQTTQLRTANDTINHERGLRATLLADDHARVVEALVLGVRAVGAYDTANETPPAETSTGLLAALTQLSSDATLRHVLSGHRGGVSTLLHSTAGSTIASVDGGGVVRIWDTTGKLTATLDPPASPHDRVTLTDDGNHVAWSSADQIVHVWRVDANEEVASFGPFGNDIRDLTFWDEGAILAIATSRKVYVYEVETRAERSIAGPKLDYNQIALASREHRYAFSTASNVAVYSLDRVRNKDLWPVQLGQIVVPPGLGSLEVLAGGNYVLMATQTGVQIDDVEQHEMVTWLASSLASRPLVATASQAQVVAAGWADDLTVQVWAAESGSRSFRAVDDGVAGLALANDGSRLAVLDKRNIIQIWQLEPLQRLTTIAGDTSVNTMIFAPDAERLVTGSSDGDARLWNLRQRKSWDIGDPSLAIRDLDVSGSRLLATANSDRVTRIWDLQQGRELVQLGANSPVTALALIRGADRGAVVTTSLDGPTRLIDLDTLVVTELADASMGVLSLAVSSDGTTIAVGDRKGAVHTWNREGKLGKSLDGPHTAVEVLAFSPDGKWLATGQDRSVVVWDLESGERKASFEGHLSSVKSLSFSPDGKWIASSSGDNVARLWNVDGQGSLVLEGHTAPLTAIAFFPDGRRVISASEDSTARTWLLETGAAELVLTEAATIRAVAVTPDGQSVITASDDGTARIWRSDDGTLVATLIGHRTGLVGAALTDDGKLLVTASSDGDLRTWPTTPNDWLQAGCEELFERAEYAQVTEACQRFEYERGQDHQKNPEDRPVDVRQLDPLESGKSQQQVREPKPDPTGNPTGSIRRLPYGNGQKTPAR